MIAGNASAPTSWVAGAAEVDVTPDGSPFLCGYPDVARNAEGVHDPLLASALCLSEGTTHALFVACDVLHLSRELVTRARRRIEEATGIPAGHVMLTATHTHSGPLIVRSVITMNDPVVPRPDPAYVKRLEDGIVEAAETAWASRRPARPLFAEADGSELGTNRRDPAGPCLPRLPVLILREAQSDEPIAVMTVCNMHPTVLHEDSRQISGDFPGMARTWLKEHGPGPRCPLVYHMGAAGNQSPRHVVKANTLEEARRLGEILGRQIQEAIGRARPLALPRLRCAQRFVELPIRSFSALQEAQDKVEAAQARLQRLRDEQAPRAETRTAECDWFGARRSLVMSRAAEAGKLQEAAAQRLPAEAQMIGIGEHMFIGWPGEVFVEFAIELMRHHPDARVITMANGDLHGYLVTREAVIEGGYEASNALFASPESGERLVEASRELLTAAPPAA